MFYTTPAIIFYPLMSIWAVLYGALAGPFFKLWAVYENWVALNREQIILWKKYPQRSYQRYIASIWAHQIRGKPIELAEYTRHQIEKDHPTEPFPLFRLITNTVFMLFIAPFMMLSGLIDGPVFVFRTARERRCKMLSLATNNSLQNSK